MKKRLFASTLAIALLFFLASCGNGSEESKSGKDSPLTEKEVEELYATPEKFKGRSVEILGVVFSEPERDGDGIYFQMWADPVNSEKNTVVSWLNSDKELIELITVSRRFRAYHEEKPLLSNRKVTAFSSL